MGNAKKTKVTNFVIQYLSISAYLVIKGSYDSKKSLTDIDMQIDSSTL